MQQEYTPKTYHIKTFGCQANIADSNNMSGILESFGFEPNEDIQTSDLIIVNTCSIRQKSEDKVYGLGRMFKGDEQIFDAGNKPFVIMAGCMVGSVTGERQRYEFEELKKKTPWVDAYINPSQVMELPNVLAEHRMLDEWAIKKYKPEEIIPIQDNKTKAYVNISYGCDNFCTFCVVPYARGREISRPKDHIMREIKHLADRGFSEITLCGQNVNSWGLETTEKFEIRTGSNQRLPFAELLREIHDMQNIGKIAFISSNPFDFTQDLIDVMKLPKIENYLHMAVQSGNNDVLKRMNRRHTIEDFKELVNNIKQVKPEIVFGTDIIVGFPGETREQFMDTVKLFEEIPFGIAYISIYSPRKGTPAEKFFEDDVPLKEKRWRHAKLTEVWNSNKPNHTF